MATVTVTAATFLETPKAVHAGVNARRLYWNSGATEFGTAGDTVLLAKLPNKATIHVTDGYLTTSATTMTGQLRVEYTVGNSVTVYNVTGTIIKGNRYIYGGPYTLNIGDDENRQYGILKLVITAGASATVSTNVNLSLLYTTDNSTPGV